MVELSSVRGEDKLERVLEVAGDQTTGVELCGEEEGGRGRREVGGRESEKAMGREDGGRKREMK